jgi:hypothetical protein
MPVVDGWEAARRLSAHALAGEREKAIVTGCEEPFGAFSPTANDGRP